MAATSAKARGSIIERFSEAYGKGQSRAELLIERAVIGANVGCRGYTSLAQADELAERLDLRRGSRLLDIGAGRGWPGLYLTKKTGCEVVLADPAAPGLQAALQSARRQRLGRRSWLVVASATALPFAPGVFDAVIHADVL